MKSTWPLAQIMLVEAQRRKESFLQAVVNDFPESTRYHLGVVGAQARKNVPFYEMDSGSSLYEEISSVERMSWLADIRPLDHVLSESRFPPIDLLKLDVQGAELDVLKGATKALKQATFVQLEAQLLPVNRGAPLFADVIAALDAWGFVAYDLFSPWRRPLDGGLRSVDVLFTRKNSVFVQDARYDASANALSRPLSSDQQVQESATASNIRR
jgi:FkbM family methyltransferase